MSNEYSEARKVAKSRILTLHCNNLSGKAYWRNAINTDKRLIQSVATAGLTILPEKLPTVQGESSYFSRHEHSTHNLLVRNSAVSQSYKFYV